MRLKILTDFMDYEPPPGRLEILRNFHFIWIYICPRYADLTRQVHALIFSKVRLK
ncbi:hypothetical protein Acid7E03_44590 [Acidisoma sp. 7E03]